MSCMRPLALGEAGEDISCFTADAQGVQVVTHGRLQRCSAGIFKF